MKDKNKTKTIEECLADKKNAIRMAKGLITILKREKEYTSFIEILTILLHNLDPKRNKRYEYNK